MRISDQQIASLMEYQINAAYGQLQQSQTELATGRQINTPADNPFGTSVALELQGQIVQTTQDNSTASSALAWMQTTDTALSGVGNVLLQARNLAVQGANGTLTADQQQALATSVGQLIQQGVQAANANYAGQYVLSGYQTSTQPFSLHGSAVTYHGDSGAIQQEISPGQSMQINVSGNGSLPAVFAAMSQLQNDLQSGNTSALGTTDLQAIDQANDGLLLTQATVGNGISRVQASQTALQTTQTNLQNQYSDIVNVDVAQASINFSTQQATYQAALTVAGKMVQPTLMNFLK